MYRLTDTYIYILIPGICLGVHNKFNMQAIGMQSRLAAVLILSSSLLAKMYMSFIVRIPMKNMNKKDQNVYLASDEYSFKSKRQLNEAEYSPLFASMLLFMHAQAISCPIAATLAVVGNVGYFWLGILSGKTQLWNTSPFAASRYIALGWLIWAIYEGMPPAPQ